MFCEICLCNGYHLPGCPEALEEKDDEEYKDDLIYDEEIEKTLDNKEKVI